MIYLELYLLNKKPNFWTGKHFSVTKNTKEHVLMLKRGLRSHYYGAGQWLGTAGQFTSNPLGCLVGLAVWASMTFSVVSLDASIVS